MLKLLLQIIGWLLAHTPEPILHAVTALLGVLMLVVSPRRRRLIFANLHHAFPEKPRAWHRHIARASSQRLFETALLSLASPYFSEKRLRRMSTLAPAVADCFRQRHAQPVPLIVATPHIAYWESLTSLSLFLDVPLGEFGVIFRPLDNPTADAWVKSTRERHGMRLLSRKEGLTEAFRILKRRATVGILFDQNAGLQGALTSLFGRVCSTTELPGLLAERSAAKIVAFYPRRIGFWRVRFELQEIPYDGTAPSATIALNRWLETTLAADDNLCASWLWSHDRWRHQDIPEKRFRLESKRDLLPTELAVRGIAAVPRKTRLWVRLPNWLGDVVMALPLLHALRLSRPDAEITFIAKPAFLPLLSQTQLADQLLPLPPRNWRYFLHFWKLRRAYPDVFLLLTHSVRGDLEAYLTGCRQRFGLIKHGRRRPLLTHRFVAPADFDERLQHQLTLTEALFRHFGLTTPLDRTPLAALTARPPAPHSYPPSAEPFPRHTRTASEAQALDSGLSTLDSPPPRQRVRIAFIAGSENTPEKRWPVPHWRTLTAALLEQFPDAHIVLCGTAQDRAITDRIAEGFPADRIENLAGRTDLPAYITLLRSCTVLVTNDTGGMHLANALGLPLIALFGPTNPLRTGPVFNSPVHLLQPPACPPTGGASLNDLLPSTVLSALTPFLKS